MNTIKELGPEIWRLRKKRKLSQRVAAELLGIGQSNWSVWERGAVVPSVRNLHKIATVVPLELEAWEPVVAEYHRQCRRASDRRKDATTPTGQEYREAAAMLRDKPRRRELKTKVSPIGEIARKARAEGLTYGEYVAKRET